MSAVLGGDVRAFCARGFQSVPTVLSHGHRAVQHLYQALGARAQDAATASWVVGKVTCCGLPCINSPEIL